MTAVTPIENSRPWRSQDAKIVERFNREIRIGDKIEAEIADLTAGEGTIVVRGETVERASLNHGRAMVWIWADGRRRFVPVRCVRKAPANG